MLRIITGFVVYVNFPQFKKAYKTQRFGNWARFYLKERGEREIDRERDTLLGPLERVNLNHWT
jgi:hypothetical protein